MFYVYVLKSQLNGRFYTGYTKDLKKRFSQHNSGQNLATRNRGPFEIVHAEVFLEKTNALKRESYLKTGKGRDELKKLGL